MLPIMGKAQGKIIYSQKLELVDNWKSIGARPCVIFHT
jgi:hypothetical protein